MPTEEMMLKLLLALISFIGGVLVYQFKGISENLHKMTDSVQQLNKEIAVIIKVQEWHDMQIRELKDKKERDRD